jgi:dephospho-CoA kinase
MSPSIILKEILPLMEGVISQIRDRYTLLASDNLDHIEKEVKELQNALSIKSGGGTPVSARLESIAGFLQRISEWLENTSDLNPDIYQNEFNEGLREQFVELFKKYPEEIKLSIPVGHWTLLRSDGFVAKFLKICSYARHPLTYIRYRKDNIAKVKTTLRRRLPLRMFLERSLSLRFYQYLSLELQHFSRLYVELLPQLHHSLESFKDETLLVGKFEQNSEYWQALQQVKVTKVINNLTSVLNEQKDRIRGYKKDCGQRLEEFKRDLTEYFNGIWEVGGTILLPQRKFTAKKIQKLWKRSCTKIKHIFSAWQLHIKSVVAEWEKDIELAIFQYRAAVLCLDTETIVAQLSQSKIIPIIAEIKNVLLQSQEKFTVFQKENLKSTILKENRALLKRLRQEKLPELLDTLFKANLDQVFGGFQDRLLEATDRLKEKYTIITDFDIEQVPPKTKIKDISLKNLVEGEITAHAKAKYKTLLQKVQSDIESLSRSISSLDQIVEFNLDAALDLLKEEKREETDDEVQQIVTDGLERTQKILKDLEERFNQSIDISTTKLKELTFDLEQEVQKLGDNEKILELNLRLARTHSKEKMLQLHAIIWGKIKNFLPRIFKFAAKYVGIAKISYFKVRKISGLEPTSSDIDRVIYKYLLDLDRNVKAMPYIYRRLFQIVPLKEERFFFGRSNALATVQEDFDLFKDGYPQSIAIIGEKGSGKTTLLNFAEKETFGEFPIIKVVITHTILNEEELLKIFETGFGPEKFSSLDELQQILLQNDNRQIIIIEDIHNLFLRVIDGFDLMEKLLSLISNTSDKHLWVVTSGIYGWNYLDEVLNISKYFKRLVNLSGLETQQVEDVIITRHTVSGFLLRFEASDEYVNNRNFSKLTSEDERQKFLRKAFFNKLSKESDGNIRTALYYWLSAIKNFQEQEVMVKMDFELDHAFLFNLPNEEIYTLAAFIQHEYLNGDEYASIFQRTIADSQLLLNRMYKRGFLNRLGNEYLVHPLLYRAVVKVLKLKNILV